MRIFFLVLLLANLALLGWIVIDRRPTVEPVITEQPAAQRLVLVKEAPAKANPPKELPPAMPSPVVEAAPNPPAPATPEAVEEEVCFSLASWPTAQDAQKAQSKLNALGAKVMQPRAITLERRRYWVLMPPFRSRNDATNVIEKLRARGVKDHYFIQKGENQNALSLGLFSSEEAAQRRIKELAQLKLKMRMQEVVFPYQAFALDVQWKGTEPDWAAQLERKDLEIQKTACP